jgi:hypothetical protein
VAILARLSFVSEFKREAGPAQVIKGCKRLIELASIVATRAVAPEEASKFRLERGERAAVRVGVTCFTSLPRPSEDTTGLGVRSDHSKLLDRWQQSIMASLTSDVCVTLFECKSCARMRIDIEVVRRETVTIMASQARLFLIRGVIKLLLVHVLMAARTLIRSATWIGLEETLPARSNMAATALQTVMRSIEGKAAWPVPAWFKDGVSARPTCVLFTVAKRASIATWPGRRIGKRLPLQEGFVMRGLVTARAGPPGSRAWVLSDLLVGQCSNRVRAAVLMALRATQPTVRIMQGKAQVMREVTQVVKVMLLAVTLFAATLHRALMHIFVALSAGLGTPEVTQLSFGQDCLVRMGVTVHAGQGLVTAV